MAPDGPETARLLRRIARAGFGTRFVRRQIPDWWEREAENESGALTEIKVILARRLGLDLASVLADGPVLLSLPEDVKFKRNIRLADTTPPESYLAYTTAVVQVVAAAMTRPSMLPEKSSAVARGKILSSSKVKWISLNALLQLCWEELGIAVIQIAAAPTNTKGFDAASFVIDGKAIIVLSKQASHRSWASFWLAHELGHLALRHVAEGSAILDESDVVDKNDAEEVAADRYGLTLLGGDDLFDVHALGEANPTSLAYAAMAVGTSRRIDPGHLILRYAQATGEWQVAQTALARLAPEENVTEFVNSIAQDLLDFNALGEDSRVALLTALYK